MFQNTFVNGKKLDFIEYLVYQKVPGMAIEHNNKFWVI